MLFTATTIAIEMPDAMMACSIAVAPLAHESKNGASHVGRFEAAADRAAITRVGQEYEEPWHRRRALRISPPSAGIT